MCEHLIILYLLCSTPWNLCIYDCTILGIPYLPTVPILTQEKGFKKRSDFTMCPYFCKNLSVVQYMYRKFRNVPIFKDFPPICPYFLGFRVGKYGIHVVEMYVW